MPHSNSTSTIFNLLLIAALTLAFFPNLFIGLLKLPLRPFTGSVANSALPKPHAQQTMPWFQKTIHLPARSRGSYLITDTIEQNLPELRTYKVGLLNLFVQHTSCALALNENWDDDVRADMSDALDRIAPEDRTGHLYRHSAEGPDDMPVRCLPDIFLYRNM
jgi:thiamine phosphate synthase YjbQ (UPF0047 family)